MIGSPVYNREITGQLKTFFDRLFYDIHKQAFLEKYAICVTTFMLSSGCAQKTLKDLTMALGYYIVGTINVNLWKFNNDVEKDEKTLKRAFDEGKKIVKIMESKKRYLKQDFIRKTFMERAFRKIDRLIEKKGLYE